MEQPQQNLQEADEEAQLMQMAASVFKDDQVEMVMQLEELLNIENPNNGALIEAGEQQQVQQVEVVQCDNTKAIKASATSLQIGQWIKKARHDDCIKARFYFKRDKNKMAWEVLMEDNLNTKIEIKFDQVSSLRPFYISSRGILEIQLCATPKFLREKEPKSKKQPKWEVIDDFTNGEASSCKKHVLEFTSRELEKLLRRIYNANTCLSSKIINQPYPAEEIHPQLQQIPLLIQQNYYNHMDFGVDLHWHVASSSSSLRQVPQSLIQPTGNYYPSVGQPSSYLDQPSMHNGDNMQLPSNDFMNGIIQEPSIMGVPSEYYGPVSNSDIGGQVHMEDQLQRYHQTTRDSTNGFNGEFQPLSSIPQDQIARFEAGSSSLQPPLQTGVSSFGSPFVAQTSYCHPDLEPSVLYDDSMYIL